MLFALTITIASLQYFDQGNHPILTERLSSGFLHSSPGPDGSTLSCETPSLSSLEGVGLSELVRQKKNKKICWIHGELSPEQSLLQRVLLP